MLRNFLTHKHKCISLFLYISCAHCILSFCISLFFSLHIIILYVFYSFIHCILLFSLYHVLFVLIYVYLVHYIISFSFFYLRLALKYMHIFCCTILVCNNYSSMQLHSIKSYQITWTRVPRYKRHQQILYQSIN